MQKSAGILLFKKDRDGLKFFLVHPGGPFWKKKDVGAWSIPKGEYEGDEEPLTAARREFYEETGQNVSGEFIELAPVRQKSGKWVYAWAVEGSIDTSHIQSNVFKLQWPPNSGKWIDVPEVDKGEWFSEEEARVKRSIPDRLHLLMIYY